MGTKRGQATFFMLIGMALIFAVIVYVLLTTIQSKPVAPLGAEKVHACAQAALEDLFLDIAFRGGYTSMPKETIIMAYGEIPLYMNNGIHFPTQQQVQTVLEEEAKERLEICMKGLKRTDGEIKVTITLLPREVQTHVTYPALLTDGVQERQLPPLLLHHKARMLTLYSIAEQIVQLITEDPLRIPSSDLLDLEEKEQVVINALWDDTKIIYFISDNDPETYDITWAFAVKA